MKKPAVAAAGLDLDFNYSNLGPAAWEQQSPQSQPVLDTDSCPILNNNSVHNETDPRQSQEARRQRSRRGGVRRRSGRVPAIQAEQRHGRIAQSSSRRSPCPVCGRVRNGHCRWGDGVWNCFVGDTNHPPSNIRIGDVIDINGEHAALVATDGGHSGNSYVFRAHTALNRTRARQVAKPAPKDSGYMAWIEVLIADADTALAITDFQLHNTPPPELQHLLALINVSTELVDDCLTKVKADTRQGWDHQITVLETAAAALKKQKRMADHFRWHYLGEVE